MTKSFLGLRLVVLVGAAAILSLINLPASAQDLYSGKKVMKNASVEDIINELSRGGEARRTPDRKTRGIRILKPAVSDQGKPGQPVNTVAASPESSVNGCYVSKIRPGTRGLSIVRNEPVAGSPTENCHPGYISFVRFAFASAELSPSSAQELDMIAEALRSDKLTTDRFLIAGHTDAAGSDAYNQGLSDRRAQAVVSYLKRRGVNPKRLAAEGRGEHELLDGKNPNSAVNRRVEIINVSR